MARPTKPISPRYEREQELGHPEIRKRRGVLQDVEEGVGGFAAITLLLAQPEERPHWKVERQGEQRPRFDGGRNDEMR